MVFRQSTTTTATPVIWHGNLFLQILLLRLLTTRQVTGTFVFLFLKLVSLTCCHRCRTLFKSKLRVRGCLCAWRCDTGSGGSGRLSSGVNFHHHNAEHNYQTDRLPHVYPHPLHTTLLCGVLSQFFSFFFLFLWKEKCAVRPDLGIKKGESQGGTSHDRTMIHSETGET